MLVHWPKSRGETGAGEWLVGVALLACPISPALSTKLWTALGLSGQASVAHLSNSLQLANHGFESEGVDAASADRLASFVQRSSVV